MGDVLDMISYRQLQRQRRRFKKDLDECSRHPSLEHHPTWEPGDSQSQWAYGPEGLSDARATQEPKPSTQEMIEDFYGKDNVDVTVVPPPLADIIPLGPAKAKRAATLTGKYLDEIIEKAYDGSQWAQFRLALIQLTDETPDEQIYIMQQTFPDMEVHQFEAFLERAIAEFDEYSDLMEENDQP